MASLTAVELGTDTCAFAHTSVRGGVVRLSAAEILDPAAFPGMDAFTVAVRQTRRTLRLPRRCRAVVWGLPDGANRKDAAVKPLLAPLTDAGFKVDRVVSPCNALAALARLKSSRGEGSTCWVAINRGGVAIVVVRPGKLLYAHSFAWDSSIGASGSQARLLQRYSLVSFLSPEVKRAMGEARKSGTPVVAVVTCGNLPDLRSLTMPLIEELDVEVETLDSFEGLTVKPQVAEKLGESAPAIRLACAAAIARGTRPWDPAKKQSYARAISRYVSAAAILAALLMVAYQWYGKPRNAVPPPFVPPPVSVQAKKAEPNPTVIPPAATSSKSPLVVIPPIVSVQFPTIPPRGAASVPAKTPESNPPAVSVPAKKPESNPPAKAPVAAPAPPTVRPSVETPVPAKAAATMPNPTVPSPLTLPMPTLRPPAVPAARPPVVSVPPAKPPVVTTAPTLNTPAVSADKPETRPAGRGRIAPPPPLLKDPVPKVTAILVSRDRRYATVDGQIVGIGDTLGRRTVVAMDERSVLFEEPSGMQIRIGLGGRLLGTERVIRQLSR